jgi:hypothetical protein
MPCNFLLFFLSSQPEPNQYSPEVVAVQDLPSCEMSVVVWVEVIIAFRDGPGFESPDISLIFKSTTVLWWLKKSNASNLTPEHNHGIVQSRRRRASDNVAS